MQVHSWDDTLPTVTNLWEVFQDEKDGQPIQFVRINPDAVVVNTPLEQGDSSRNYGRRSGSSYRGWDDYRGGNWS